MGFEQHTMFNRTLLPLIRVRNITLVLGVAVSEVANRERFNVVSGLELNQQRWPSVRVQVGCLLLGRLK